jgi:hypothetical protein
MEDGLVMLRKSRLLSIIKEVYELGCIGYAELSDEIADQKVEEIIASLPKKPITPDVASRA